jgi:ribonucleotide monophosphatase NagD (HAD superfamily)
MILPSLRVFLWLQLDGCLWKGNTPIPGATEVISLLRSQVQHNAIQGPEMYMSGST